MKILKEGSSTPQLTNPFAWLNLKHEKAEGQPIYALILGCGIDYKPEEARWCKILIRVNFTKNITNNKLKLGKRNSRTS